MNLQVEQAVRLRRHRRLRTVARVGLAICTLASPWLLHCLFLTSPQDIPYASSLLMVPALILVAAALFTFVWKNDLNLRLLFGSAIVTRCAFSALFLWMSYAIYDAEADAFHYWDRGLIIAEDFTVMGLQAFHPPYWSTNFMINLTGLITVGVGNALPTLFIMFALIGLAGGYFFYRAFSIAFPQADRLSYGYVAMLLPSIMFWSCSLSKDALAQFFVGMAALGFAKITKRMSPFAVLLYCGGILGMLAVRPHVAGMLALAGMLPYVLGKSRGGFLAMGLKIIIIPIVLAGTFYIARQSASFLGVDKGGSTNAVDTVNGLSKSSDYGGSAYGGGSLAVRVAEAPILIFRPLPFEVHNVTSAAASLEGVGIMIFAWTKRRRIWRLVRRHWRHPYVAFILCFSALFSVAFAAATSNFGILVRQRIMMVPLILMLLFAEVPDEVVSPATSLRSRRAMENFARPQTSGMGAD